MGGDCAVTVLGRLYETVAEMTRRLDALAERLPGWTWVEELAALHALQVQAQALLDMAMRLAAELGHRPESPREAAEMLLEEGALTREDYDFIQRVIGFRNAVVHGYAGVDAMLARRAVERRGYRRVARLAAGLLEWGAERGIDP